MDDINKFTDDNLGGIFLFRFIPIEDIATIPEPLDHEINAPVTLTATARWFDFYGTPGTIELSEDDNQNEAGTYYKKKLTAITPKNRTELDKIFTEMRHRQFVLDVTDNNGIRKLVGSTTEPLKFKCKSSTKSEAAQRNEYAIEFYGDGVEKSYTYNI